MKPQVLYTSCLLTTVVACFALIGAFNARHDPMDYLWTGETETPNYGHPRISKTYLSERVQPECVVIGSSRPELAISPEHEKWPHRPVMNMAFSGTGIIEMAAYFEHVAAVSSVRLALVMLDYNACDPEARIQPSFDANRLHRLDGGPSLTSRCDDFRRALLSWEATEDSLAMARGSWLPLFSPTGQRDEWRHYDRLKENGGLRVSFQRNMARFPTEARPTLEGDWKALRRMVRVASQKEIEVIWVITPLHDVFWRKFVERDGLETVLGWRRKVLEVIQSEADLCGLGPQHYWDFDGTDEVVLG